MACKVYFFDLKECEKQFFDKDKCTNFDVTFFDWGLNSETVKNIIPQDRDNVMMLCVNSNSKLSADVIKNFKNLRLISTRTNNIEHIDLQTCTDNNIAIVNIENEGDCETNLKNAFVGMSSYLCGEKCYRII